jgi:hypothetical protein
MSRHGTPIIKKIRYGSLVYVTLYDTLIGDTLRHNISNGDSVVSSTMFSAIFMQLIHILSLW